jgi:hypothetical protein
LVVVLTIAAVGLGIATFSFGSYLARTSARRAAQVFSRDLAQARAFATRSRESVTVVFLEDSLSYTVDSEGGRNLARRRFGGSDEITLTDLDLELDGDTVRFDMRGLAELPGIGTASFRAGADEYEVRFNGTGVSRMVRR